MIVTSISPTYHAAPGGNYTLLGGGFRLIPADAVGKFSYSNDNPLQFLTDTSVVHQYNITIVSDNEMRLTLMDGAYATSPTYLGCICLQDGSETYWVNETQPLP